MRTLAHFRLFALAGLAGLTLAACGGGASSATPQASAAAPQPNSPAAQGCTTSGTLSALQAAMPYAEYNLSHNSIDEVSNLNVWFVEPDLDATAQGADISDNAQLARNRSTDLALQLTSQVPCTATLFDGLTLIAVDAAYNAWYIAGVVPSMLPASPDLSEAERAGLADFFNEGFLRTAAVAAADPAPSDSCTWPQARQRLSALLDASHVNVGYHYYSDDQGGAIWVQYNSPPEAVSADEMVQGFVDPLPQIDEAVSCLYPAFTTLWVVYVFPNGQAQLIVAVDGAAVRATDHQVMMDQMEVVYPYQQQ